MHQRQKSQLGKKKDNGKGILQKVNVLKTSQRVLGTLNISPQDS